MNDSNPYAPPKAHVADASSSPPADVQRLNRVASGQRLVVVSLIVSLAALGLRAAVGEAGMLISLFGSIIGIVGVVRLSSALGSHVVVRVLYAICMLLPLVNLLIMARLSAKATKALRAAGYRVGLFGASQRATWA
jgi:hypothetical protein